MAHVIAGMTISLDGFIADASGSAGALYPDLDELRDAPYMAEAQAETGAALMGRRTFDGAEDPDDYADSYELQVPVFVLTHTPPAREPRRNDRLSFTFVTDGIESALRQATAAAGDKAVSVIGGASVNQQLLAAGLVDELRVDVMPVLFGAGTRLFDGVPAGIRLEKTGIEDVGVRTQLRFRVVR